MLTFLNNSLTSRLLSCALEKTSKSAFSKSNFSATLPFALAAEIKKYSLHDPFKVLLFKPLHAVLSFFVITQFMRPWTCCACSVPKVPPRPVLTGVGVGS